MDGMIDRKGTKQQEQIDDRLAEGAHGEEIAPVAP